jgi:hypothetical protein
VLDTPPPRSAVSFSMHLSGDRLPRQPLLSQPGIAARAGCAVVTPPRRIIGVTLSGKT